MKLFTPGPTQVPDFVLQKCAEPLIHHRTPEFRAALKNVESCLQQLFCTNRDVLILTSSGTGAMEAAVANICSPGDRVLVLEMGKFSQRWREIAEAFGVRCDSISVDWGKSIRPEQLEEHLEKNSGYHAVFMTHSETSTGAALELERIAEVVRKFSSALLVVDGISSVGVMPLYPEKWGLDLVLSGSQKGFLCPPGLSFVCCSQRAYQAMEVASLPRYYFDLLRAREALLSQNTPFTPASSLILALEVALQKLCLEKPEDHWRRYARIARGVRAGIRALGLRLVAEIPSNSLTAFWIPESLRDLGLGEKLRQRGFQLAGGQGSLKGKILRIGHMGDLVIRDFEDVLVALGELLTAAGWPVGAAAGVNAFRKEMRRS